jgi:polysaccharide deacetylase family protein (PEP-CTERM system associated)
MSSVLGSPDSRAAAAPGGTSTPVLNAMTIDVEDYFHVSAFEAQVSRASWASRESRVCRNTERLLELFEQSGVKATFFVLGWVAERHPGLVRRIAALGHEVASHSYAHQLVYALTPEQFRDDLRRARGLLEAATGEPVLGYRAPSYSIIRQSMWALDVLIDEGYFYDSSIYPIRHDRYGIPEWDRHIHRIERANGTLWELPGSTIRVGGTNLPIGGGGYFRLLPYMWTQRGIRRLNAEGHPSIFYLHPWEIDPGQPRLHGSALSRFRHYRHLNRTEDRLRRLLAEFRFGRVRDVLVPATSGQVARWQPAAIGVEPVLHRTV